FVSSEFSSLTHSKGCFLAISSSGEAGSYQVTLHYGSTLRHLHTPLYSYTHNPNITNAWPAKSFLDSLSSQAFSYEPNPVLKPLDPVKAYRYNPGSFIQLEGDNLDLAITKEEVVVLIGEGVCAVKTLTKNHLYCEPPPQQPNCRKCEGSDNLPEFTVQMGHLNFSLGKVQYDNLSSPTFPLEAQIGVGIGASIVALIVFIIVLIYRMYAERIFFPGHRESPLRRGLDMQECRRQTVEQGLVQLSNLLNSKLFLTKDSAGESLYILFKAIKHQVDKGPVDAVTRKAKHTLNDNRLLREDVEYKTLGGGVNESQPLPSKVLDCDTITQVKEKLLDQVYKSTSFSHRPHTDSLDLEWRSGVAGHLILSDEDLTSVVQGSWKRLNTLQHYKKFVDDLFTVILSTSRPVPLAVKYFFDLLDDQAGQHNITDPETIHIWKTNRYYADIRQTISASDQEMNSALAEMSRNYSGELNYLVALHELYKYINKYYDQVHYSF
ncbi:hypothetical protein GOODEAATRI_011050, partial [Goodea atripinnis]